MSQSSTENTTTLTASPVGEAPIPEGHSVETGGDPPEPSALDPNRLQRALDLHRAELEAIRPEQFASVNVSIPEAAMLVLNATKRWAPYAERIGTLSAEVNGAQIAKIAGFARATLQAHANLVITSAPENQLHATLQQGMKLGDRLSAEAKVLAERGLLPVKSLVQIDHTTGYRAVAMELTALATLLGNSWSGIAGKTAITLQDLDEAKLIANKIFEDAAERDLRHPEIVEARKLRMQAFTAMVRAYEEMRRCIAFLEPSKLEDLAPALSQVRGRGNASQPEEQPVEPPVEQTVPTPNPEAPQAQPGSGTGTPGATTANTVTGPNGLVVPSPFR